MGSLRNLRTGAILARCVKVAETSGARSLQLRSRDVIRSDDGLWLDDCREIDTFGMRVAIDILFLDETRRVLAAHLGVAPNQREIRCARACSAVQLGESADRDVRHGDVLALD